MPVGSMFIIIPVAIVVMMIPISINAIGIREVIFVAMFGAFGVNSADALAFAWMSFVLLTILGVIGGVVFVLLIIGIVVFFVLRGRGSGNIL